MSERCEYCGRTERELERYNITSQRQRVLCTCCYHCEECKLLHRNHKETIKTKEDYHYYVYQSS